VEAVLASSGFERAEQLRSFLRYICEMELSGHGAELSEYVIGVEALGKPPGYSTGDDSSVRRRAHDLRQRLDEVYVGELASARVRIELPKGRYAPRFVYAASRADDAVLARAVEPVAVMAGMASPGPALDRARSRVLAKVFWFGFIVGLLAAGTGLLLWLRLRTPAEPAPEPGQVIEAELRANALGGSARTQACPACSGHGKVKWIGKDSFVSIQVPVPTAGDYMVQIDYLVEGARTFVLSVNDGPGVEVAVRGNSWGVPASTGLVLPLRAGLNAIRFYNPRAYAPDLDRIVVR
jgi:hypothetical protein